MEAAEQDMETAEFFRVQEALYEKFKLRWEKEGIFSYIKNNREWLEMMYFIKGSLLTRLEPYPTLPPPPWIQFIPILTVVMNCL